MRIRATIAGLMLFGSAAGAQTFGGFDMQLNGSGGGGTPLVTPGGVLRLMNDQYGSATSAFTTGTFAFDPSTAWTTSFTLHYAFTSSDVAHLFFTGGDGIAFVVQGGSATALGDGGGYMGYGNIANSLAISFRSFNDDILQGMDGNINDGSNPTDLPKIASNAGIGINPGDDFFLNVALSYSGAAHKMTVDYTNKFGTAFSDIIDLDPTSVGSTARFGFTAGSGSATQLAEVTDWKVGGLDYTPLAVTPPSTTATPEPATISLVGTGALFVGAIVRRRRRA